MYRDFCPSLPIKMKIQTENVRTSADYDCLMSKKEKFYSKNNILTTERFAYKNFIADMLVLHKIIFPEKKRLTS